MNIETKNDPPRPSRQEPSPWVRHFAPLLPPGAEVLDLACGQGRHSLWLARCGYRVTAVDRDADALAALAEIPGIHAQQADLEAAPWPYHGRRFNGIVVTNYLYRPLLPLLIDALAPEGLLVYETFMAGHERHGKPMSPDFLLQPGELLETVRGHLQVLVFEQGTISQPREAVIQRLAAIRSPRPKPLPS